MMSARQSTRSLYGDRQTAIRKRLSCASSSRCFRIQLLRSAARNYAEVLNSNWNLEAFLDLYSMSWMTRMTISRLSLAGTSTLPSTAIVPRGRHTSPKSLFDRWRLEHKHTRRRRRNRQPSVGKHDYPGL
ncbi:MAG: hypothetical protein MZU97_09845 [Bacillus subtilis]|nr:hypothetical protein [Bacillus subtilis]